MLCEIQPWKQPFSPKHLKSFIFLQKWLIFNIFLQGKRNHWLTFIVNGVYKLYIICYSFLTLNKTKWCSCKYSVLGGDSPKIIGLSILSFSEHRGLWTSGLWILPLSPPSLHNELGCPAGSLPDVNGCACVTSLFIHHDFLLPLPAFFIHSLESYPFHYLRHLAPVFPDNRCIELHVFLGPFVSTFDLNRQFST